MALGPSKVSALLLLLLALITSSKGYPLYAISIFSYILVKSIKFRYPLRRYLFYFYK